MNTLFQRLVLMIFFIVYSPDIYTQSDSLTSALKYQKEDSNRLNTLNHLSEAFLNEGNFEGAIQSGNVALALAKKMKSKKGEATAYQKLAKGYIFQNKDSIADHYYSRAIALNRELGNERIVGDLYFEIALARAMASNYPETLKYLYESLKISERLKDSNSIAVVLQATGTFHLIMNNYTEALNDLQTSLKLFEIIGDETEMAGSFAKLGQLYRTTGKYRQALIADSAALKIYTKSGDDFAAAWILSSIGRTIEKQASTGTKISDANFQQALKNYNAALELFRETRQAPESYPVVKMQILIGHAYLRLKNFTESRKYLSKSLQLAAQTNHKENLEYSHLYLAELDSTEGNFKDAYYHYRQHLLYRDSLVSKEGIATSLAYKMQYDREKSEILARAQQEKKDYEARRLRNLQLFGIAFFLLLAIFFFVGNRQQQKAKGKIELAYTELKDTQAQLIQSEKMASLGELTAGIAHEIQNPLNFVNNFSEVNKELLFEMNDEIDKGNFDEVKAIANDVIDNEEKIIQHGKRADAIVKGMLQHSRSSSGVKEPTDINALADEYLRLAYHGMRAKDKSFNATLTTDFDESIGNINVIRQDIGRVILNLITNAFYAIAEKKRNSIPGYQPTVTVSTKLLKPPSGTSRPISDRDQEGGFRILVSVADNGNGIPKKVMDKIFQPFFTTKPTGQGTGLGLSLSYDIVKAHGGELKVETTEGHGSEFIIQLPTKS